MMSLYLCNDSYIDQTSFRWKIGLWSDDSRGKCTLTYRPLWLDKFLAEDSLVFTIYEYEVIFGWNAIIYVKNPKFVKHVALPTKISCTLLKKQCVSPKTNFGVVDSKNKRIFCQKFIQSKWSVCQSAFSPRITGPRIIRFFIYLQDK
jgi:hypothetical protein